MPGKTVTLRVSMRAFHTILAALRFYQERGQCDSGKRSESIEELATNAGQAHALDADEIDELCERINTTP